MHRSVFSVSAIFSPFFYCFSLYLIKTMTISATRFVGRRRRTEMQYYCIQQVGTQHKCCVVILAIFKCNNVRIAKIFFRFSVLKLKILTICWGQGNSSCFCTNIPWLRYSIIFLLKLKILSFEIKFSFNIIK